jgi:amino acid transporter
MVEHGDAYYEKLLYSRAASTIKVHGVVSIVFGGLGVLFGILMIALSSLGTISDPTYDSYSSSFGLFFLSLLVLVFWLLPHAYLIASGAYLIKEPSPKLARTLIIINLIVGVFYNLVILVFAIVNLTQSGDYERGYHAHKKPAHHVA